MYHGRRRCARDEPALTQMNLVGYLTPRAVRTGMGRHKIKKKSTDITIVSTCIWIMRNIQLYGIIVKREGDKDRGTGTRCWTCMHPCNHTTSHRKHGNLFREKVKLRVHLPFHAGIFQEKNSFLGIYPSTHFSGVDLQCAGQRTAGQASSLRESWRKNRPPSKTIP